MLQHLSPHWFMEFVNFQLIPSNHDSQMSEIDKNRDCELRFFLTYLLLSGILSCLSRGYGVASDVPSYLL